MFIDDFEHIIVDLCLIRIKLPPNSFVLNTCWVSKLSAYLILSECEKGIILSIQHPGHIIKKSISIKWQWGRQEYSTFLKNIKESNAPLIELFDMLKELNNQRIKKLYGYINGLR